MPTDDQLFGTWAAADIDADLSRPPYWTAGADLDDPNDNPGSAYAIGADHRPDWPGFDVAQRGAAVEWTRVVAAAGDGAPSVVISGDDRVDVIGNDVRQMRTAPMIHLGLYRLTPAVALHLLDALAEAFTILTGMDPDNARGMLDQPTVTAAPDPAGHPRGEGIVTRTRAMLDD